MATKKRLSTMLTNASLSFTGPALSVFYLLSISYFIKEFLLGQDRRGLLIIAFCLILVSG